MAFTLSQIAPKTERFSYEATLRYSLELAENNDKQLATRARSSGAGAMAATQESLREIAKANKPEAQPDIATWDHSYWKVTLSTCPYTPSPSSHPTQTKRTKRGEGRKNKVGATKRD